MAACNEPSPRRARADPDPSLVKVVVRSLAEIGDAAVLAALERASAEPALAFLRGETLAAIQGIRERIG